MKRVMMGEGQGKEAAEDRKYEPLIKGHGLRSEQTDGGRMSRLFGSSEGFHYTLAIRAAGDRRRNLDCCVAPVLPV